MIQSFYTIIGDIYTGEEYDEPNFPDYKIVIQASKSKEYEKLPYNEKTRENISKYGWFLKNETIVEVKNTKEIPKSKTINLKGDSWSSEYDRKVMFIFGAGASAHCVYGSDATDFYNDKLRPPLGPALFEKRFKDYYLKYKGVKQSLHFLQDDQTPDVEELFEREWKNILQENNQEILSRHINIQYYLQEVLNDVSHRVIDEYFAKNLYAKLADKIQKFHTANIKTSPAYRQSKAKNFAFVSFNQDTILEYFISDYFKRPIKTMEDYVNVNKSPFCIFKPHGSCNWGWKFPNISAFGNNTANWLFKNNFNYYDIYYKLLGDSINMIDWSNWGMEKVINKNSLGKDTIDKSKLQIIENNYLNNYFPALLLPYRDKDEFTMPLPHFQKMRSYFGHVETLIIIGWKGNEDAFNRQLIKNGTKVNKVIIADPNPDIVKKNLDPFLKKRNVTPILYDNFEHFVMEGFDKELN